MLDGERNRELLKLVPHMQMIGILEWSKYVLGTYINTCSNTPLPNEICVHIIGVEDSGALTLVMAGRMVLCVIISLVKLSTSPIKVIFVLYHAIS